MTTWIQCDCCGRLTDRVHHTEAYGSDTTACDSCCCYDAEAYDEPRARYLDEQPHQDIPW